VIGRILICVAVALVVTVTVASSAGAQSTIGPPSLAFNARAYPYGRSMVTWSESWWRWLMSSPASSNPNLDATGADCGQGQGGDVFFLASTFGPGSLTRTCTVPAKTALLVPLSAYLNDYPCPASFGFEPPPGETLEQFLAEGAAGVEDGVTSLSLTVDGAAVPNLFDYRYGTPLFHFTGDPSLTAAVDPCVTGTNQVAAADGFYVILKPLAPGAHTVTFGAASPNIQSSITYQLSVR
jgi:hypothetical protein